MGSTQSTWGRVHGGRLLGFARERNNKNRRITVNQNGSKLVDRFRLGVIYQGIELGYTSDFSKIFTPAFFGAVGFSMALVHNLLQRRPVMSGIQKHIALTALCVPVGLYAERRTDAKSARRDDVLIHYMKLHPERFPETERVQFKDVLQPWVPLR